MALDSVPYTDGTAPAVTIHTYERQASIEDDELHYQFHIRQRKMCIRDSLSGVCPTGGTGVFKERYKPGLSAALSGVWEG